LSVKYCNFGIGCFIFELKEDYANVQKWFESVKNELGSISSIYEIVTNLPGKIFQGRVDIFDDESSDVKDVPQPTAGEVSFKLKIPERFQVEYSPYFYVNGKQPATADFAVTIKYSYDGPVTFVEPLGIADDSLASFSVVSVREHLIRELQKSGGRMTMYTIGPSPFHVDFRISRSTDAAPEGVEPIERRPMRGYDLCEFKFYKEHGFDLAKEVSYKVLADELSLFYRISKDSMIRSRHIGDLYDSFNELVEFHQRTGFRGVAGRIFRTSRKARTLLLDLFALESIESHEKKGAGESVKMLSGDGRRILFEDKFAELMEHSHAGELGMIRNSASMLESGRTKDFEVAIIALATVVGGLAGTVSSLILK